MNEKHIPQITEAEFKAAQAEGKSILYIGGYNHSTFPNFTPRLVYGIVESNEMDEAIRESFGGMTALSQEGRKLIKKAGLHEGYELRIEKIHPNAEYSTSMQVIGNMEFYFTIMAEMAICGNPSAKAIDWHNKFGDTYANSTDRSVQDNYRVCCMLHGGTQEARGNEEYYKRLVEAEKTGILDLTGL